MKTVLVTGSAGLIGSEAVRFFCRKGYYVVGIDNDMRSYFFGKSASTAWNRTTLEKSFKNYSHKDFDIRDETKITHLFREYRFDLIIHTAAQPSHDWAAREPKTDFTINALGTLNLLESFRLHAPKAVFIFTSTNKVYGDRPNTLPLVEQRLRFELPRSHRYYDGIDESMSIDDTLHSVFGASKVAADVMVVEYGRYFGLKTAVFRGGCLTGPSHSGAKLHGFLAYLVQCIVSGNEYVIYGYKGKQVRDNIHSRDVISAFYHFYERPRLGEIYNLGGGRFSNVSIREAIGKIEAVVGKKAVIRYEKTHRIGDHIWYVTSMTKFKRHYPGWRQEYDTDAIIQELCSMGHTISHT